MCDDRGARGAARRPRWGRLYALAALGLGALAAVERLVAAPGLRTALGALVVGVTWGVVARWVRAQRAVLDRLDWCACAWQRTTVRVVASQPAPQAPDTAPVAALH